MGELMTQARRIRTRAASSEGFSLIEVIISTAILATGLLALAGYMAYGLAYVSGSSFAVLAREKAREAVESVHTARDTGPTVVDEDSERDADGGVFKDGLHRPHRPPASTASSTRPTTGRSKSFARPGPDGLLGNSDDHRQPLTNFKRQITISDSDEGRHDRSSTRTFARLRSPSNTQCRE